jgi:hypothetical protein
VRQECVDRGVIDWDCFPENSAARFFRNVLGIGVNDLNRLNALVNAWRAAGKIPAESGAKIIELEAETIKKLREIRAILDEIYRRVPVEIQPRRYEVREARDLVDAYVEVLNAGLKLLPLYNPFTFFLNSLRLVPKPYLRVMYGDRIFDESVRALMEKYGVRIGLRIAPGLGRELDEELGIVGHEEGTTGDLVARLVSLLYDLFPDELDKYVGRYRAQLERLPICSSRYPGAVSRVFIGHGIAHADSLYKRPYYPDFLEDFSPIMYLGFVRVGGSGYFYISPDLYKICGR